MLQGQRILPESTTQPVPYTPYGGDWAEEQIKPGTEKGAT